MPFELPPQPRIDGPFEVSLETFFSRPMHILPSKILHTTLSVTIAGLTPGYLVEQCS
ncbi:MAG TPA: hypothetical protein VFQ79_24200 [Bryobacteraceae bacterium]|nr:hypothetical protein [Bryobacteraceae bacterium]